MKSREKQPCKFHMKSTKDNFENEQLELKLDEVEERYAGVYGELAEIIGDAQVLKIWKRFSGVNVTFPQRLYSKEYTSAFIEEHRGDMTAAEIAKELGLTERRVRQISKDIREGK